MMMRIAALLLLLGATTALAQEAVPDPTDPASYYPLAVGNVWEYANIGLLPTVAGWYTRREVVRDSVYEGWRYFVEEWTRIALDYAGGWVEPYERVVRFDTVSARVVSLEDNGVEIAGCSFRADFGAEVSCSEDPMHPPETLVMGGLDQPIPLGRGPGIVGEGPTDTVVVAAVKAFVYNGLADYSTHPYYAAPIGYAGETAGFCACWRNLTYARVRLAGGGVYEVGARYNVADERAPEGARLGVRAFPSPASGPVTVAVSVPEAARLTVEAVDALGRRVWRAEADAAPGEHRLDVDAGAWAPGLYVVRATAGGEAVTTTVIRR